MPASAGATGVTGMEFLRSACDDFGVLVALSSKLDLPVGRETVLALFEAVRRRFPHLTEFDRRDESDHVLESDRDAAGVHGPHAWVGVDKRRVAVGFTNPASAEAVDALAECVLGIAPDHLGVTRLDADALDVVYSFDLDHAGNHDEVVADALAGGGPDGSGVRPPGGKVLLYQPAITVALDDTCRLQAKLNIDTRSTVYQVRTGQFAELPVTVYATVRQFWAGQPHPSFVAGYRAQRDRLDALCAEWVVPGVVGPIARAIGARQ